MTIDAGTSGLIGDRDPVPDFEACNVTWDPGDGWTCTKCWATDGGD